MGWVWHSSRSKGTDRLVLLAIADCAADDGGNAFPSMATLVTKTGLSERTVQGATTRLVQLGELKVRHKAGSSNRYRVIMDAPADPAPPQILHPAGDAPTPAAVAPPPPQQLHPTPAAAAPITVLEPSPEPSKNLSALNGARPRARDAPTRGTRIPADFTITADMATWAAENVPRLDISHETAQFVDWWTAKPGAGGVKLDWIRTWQVWMRKEAKGLPPPGRTATIARTAQCPTHRGQPAHNCSGCAGDRKLAEAQAARSAVHTARAHPVETP